MPWSRNPVDGEVLAYQKESSVVLFKECDDENYIHCELASFDDALNEIVMVPGEEWLVGSMGCEARIFLTKNLSYFRSITNENRYGIAIININTTTRYLFEWLLFPECLEYPLFLTSVFACFALILVSRSPIISGITFSDILI